MTARNILIPLLLATLPVFAATDHGGHGDPFLLKKIVNFALLAAGIGYLFVKVLNPALRGQQQEIAANLNQAQRRAEEAAAHAREIEARVAGLDAEIAALRDKAAAELRAEAERIERDTAAQFAKVDQNAQQEIDSAVKFARQELRAYSARLAVDLARTRIEAGLDEAAQSRLVHRFTATLDAAQADRN